MLASNLENLEEGVTDHLKSLEEIPLKKIPGNRPRLSLEQKIMRLVRRFRAAEKRRKQSVARSKRLSMLVLSTITTILFPSLAILF